MLPHCQPIPTQRELLSTNPLLPPVPLCGQSQPCWGYLSPGAAPVAWCCWWLSWGGLLQSSPWGCLWVHVSLCYLDWWHTRGCGASVSRRACPDTQGGVTVPMPQGGCCWAWAGEAAAGKGPWSLKDEEGACCTLGNASECLYLKKLHARYRAGLAPAFGGTGEHWTWWTCEWLII